jgi:MSHA pilin protein MshC
MTRSAARSAGFTMVELVTVMVVASILAVFALPKLTNTHGTDERSFYDEVQTALRYGQKIALASRRNVCVRVANPNVSLLYAVGAACAAGNPAVPVPGGAAAAYTITAPTGVAVGPNGFFQFDSANSGSPLPNASHLITVGNRTVTVEINTGYVH